MQANCIEEEKELPLTVTGAEASEILKNLTVPASPHKRTCHEAKQLLEEHYSPRSLGIAECCRFKKRTRHEGESVENVMVELKHLARK